MDEDCELCNAREAVGEFDLEGVEVKLCASCSVYRKEDGSVALTDARGAIL